MGVDFSELYNPRGLICNEVTSLNWPRIIMKMRKEERNIQSIRLRISRISKIDRIEKGPSFYFLLREF